MAIGVPDNFSYGGKKANFDRDQFNTLAEMRAYSPDFLDEGHISYCKQDKKHYKWNGTEWEEFSAGIKIVTSESELDVSAPKGSFAVVASTDDTDDPILYIKKKKNGGWEKFNEEITQTINALTEGMVVGEGKDLTIANAIDKAIEDALKEAIYDALNAEY